MRRRWSRADPVQEAGPYRFLPGGAWLFPFGKAATAAWFGLAVFAGWTFRRDPLFVVPVILYALSGCASYRLTRIGTYIKASEIRAVGTSWTRSTPVADAIAFVRGESGIRSRRVYLVLSDGRKHLLPAFGFPLFPWPEAERRGEAILSEMNAALRQSRSALNMDSPPLPGPDLIFDPAPGPAWGWS